ncbi:hypothetical protein QNN95_07245 [Exiguobacterium acetylicum]|uniref:hypothetical protein n=1 Tax=Exiguobacterium acetylicum TaxID=41170 RepID=UPI0035A59652
MKKVGMNVLVVFLLLGGLLFYLDVRYDERFEQHVSTKVETYVEKKYGPAHVVSLHSAYDDKHRDKEKRYKIAVKVQGQGLQKEEYLLYRFQDDHVVEMGTTTSLPKRN